MSKVHHKISQCYLEAQFKLIEQCLDLVFQNMAFTNWALLDFPDHTNVGDSAIWLGTLRLLTRRLGGTPTIVSRHREFPNSLGRLSSNEVIIFSGGGNFGDLWSGYWQNRVKVLKSFPYRKIVQMPQSIYFSNLTDSAFVETQRAVSSHRDFTLLVRDLVSLDFAKKHFDCPSYLCPDSAFGLGALPKIGDASCEVLGLLRSDKEKNLLGNFSSFKSLSSEETDWVSINNFGSKRLKVCRRMYPWLARMGPVGMVTLERAFAHQAGSELNRGVGILSRGKVVITDRLHGHIICCLMGSPHVVLDNIYGKVTNYLASFPDHGLTFLASSLSDAFSIAHNMLLEQ